MKRKLKKNNIPLLHECKSKYIKDKTYDDEFLQYREEGAV